MKLHASPRSPYVRKVMMTAWETGTADRLQAVATPVSVTNANRALMRVNPLSKIPTLELDDGRVLYDSIVICEYLDHLGVTKVFPTDFDVRIEAMRLHALGQGMTDLLQLWRHELGRPKAIQSQPHMDTHEAKFWGSVDTLEAGADALAARGFDIGAISIVMALGYADFRFPQLDWRQGRPKLAAWFAAAEQRPSVSKTRPPAE